MDCFRRRLVDRIADVRDWVDYRPDANFWPFFALPPVLSATWAYVGPIGLGLILGFALLASLAVALVAATGVAAWVAASCLADTLGSIRLRVPSTVRIPSKLPVWPASPSQPSS